MYVEVTNNGVDFTSDRVVFTYVAAMSFASLTPKLGPMEGGTQVVVRGTGFDVDGGMLCRFGNETVGAMVHNETTMVCETPEMDRIELVTVDVSSNGVDFIYGSLEFSFGVNPDVVDILPGYVSEDGGEIIVVGDNIEASMDTKCRFGRELVTLASRLSSSTVRCFALAHAGAYFGRDIE